MLAAWCGAKRGASSIQTIPEGSVIASTSFGSGRRQALAGASRRMSAVVRGCGADAFASTKAALAARIAATALDRTSRKRMARPFSGDQHIDDRVGDAHQRRAGDEAGADRL